MDEPIHHLLVAALNLWNSAFWPRYRPGAPTAPSTAPLEVGQLVTVAPDVAGLQSVQGFMVAAERLGLGTVGARDAAGKLCVRWSQAGVETWAEGEDLRPIAPGWSLVTIVRCDGRGHRTRLRQGTALLQHHWTVELLPDDVIRAVRDDTLAWTFKFNPVSHAVIASWLYPYEDDDAEALTAAELAAA